MKKIVPIVIIVIRKNGKYLLTYRTDSDNPHDNDTNIWQIPGGALEFKETLEHAVIREAKEELGVDITIKQFIPKIYESMRKSWHGILFSYLCSIKNIDQKIRLNEEASQYNWFTKEEVENLSRFPETYNILCDADKILT